MTFASNGTSITYNGRVVGEIASSCDHVPMGVYINLPRQMTQKIQTFQ